MGALVQFAPSFLSSFFYTRFLSTFYSSCYIVSHPYAWKDNSWEDRYCYIHLHINSHSTTNSSTSFFIPSLFLSLCSLSLNLLHICLSLIQPLSHLLFFRSLSSTWISSTNPLLINWVDGLALWCQACSFFPMMILFLLFHNLFMFKILSSAYLIEQL